MLEFLKKLCEADGVSGSENCVAELIIKEINPFTQISRDRLGNIIAFKKGRVPAKTKLMLCAHMDEVGLMVTTVTEKGLLKFERVGGIDPRVIVGRRVFVGEKRVAGVIGVTAVHLINGDEIKKAPPADKLYIDIGADSKQDAESLVSIGDTAVFESEFIEFGDGFIKAKALDDRAGCAILTEMIKAEQEFDMYFVFTVQEEIGARGAKTASFAVKPEAAIVIDSTTAADIPFVDEYKKVCCADGGPVVSFMDKGTIYDRSLYELALKTAEELGIPCQPKKAVAGGNDSSSVHISGEGVKTIAVSLPCRYIHTANCVLKLIDLTHTLNLVTWLAHKIAADQV